MGALGKKRAAADMLAGPDTHPDITAGAEDDHPAKRRTVDTVGFVCYLVHSTLLYQ